MGYLPGWITKVPGLTRGQQIKAAGNGVVSQQAYAAYAWLLAQTAEEIGVEEKAA